MGTKEKITQRALELFNQNGIEYVGMRELADSLGMKIGNITYYFPTKNDLVNQLALDLSALNSKTLSAGGNLTMLSFLERRAGNFHNQYKYRCLFLSFVHIIKQNPIVAKRYKHVEKERGEGLITDIKILEKQKYLSIPSPEMVRSLAAATGLIARFWISEAAISHPTLSVERLISHYTGLFVSLLTPYATKAGDEQIKAFLKQQIRIDG